MGNKKIKQKTRPIIIKKEFLGILILISIILISTLPKIGINLSGIGYLILLFIAIYLLFIG